MTRERVLVGVRAAWVLVVAAGLAFDAYVHFHLAGTYDVIKTSALSQGDLFRAEGSVAILAALAVLARPRRYTAALAFLVAASALGVVLLYRFVNVGRLGPVPSMYEPTWYPEKLQAAWAEAAALVASAAVFGLVRPRARETVGASGAN
ncbi:MAG: hypothetical protein QOG80_2279 [Pseudonocardiales bacterium]|nr:hypothetical protein [Pseudonocardiales bacterium]